jgi:hypothetical protein
MNKMFLTIHDDVVMSQLVSVDLVKIDFPYASISLITYDDRNQYASSSEKSFSYKNHKDADNIDENITQYGWKGFDALAIEDQDTAKLLPVLVTDLTSTVKITGFTRNTSPITIGLVDD